MAMPTWWHLIAIPVKKDGEQFVKTKRAAMLRLSFEKLKGGHRCFYQAVYRWQVMILGQEVATGL